MTHSDDEDRDTDPSTLVLQRYDFPEGLIECAAKAAGVVAEEFASLLATFPKASDPSGAILRQEMAAACKSFERIARLLEQR